MKPRWMLKGAAVNERALQQRRGDLEPVRTQTGDKSRVCIFPRSGVVSQKLLNGAGGELLQGVMIAPTIKANENCP